MQDRTYSFLAALLCVTLAFWGIYHLTRDTPIWNEWTGLSSKELTDRIPETEN